MSLLSDEIIRALRDIRYVSAIFGALQNQVEGGGAPAQTFNWKGTDYPFISAVPIASKLFGAGGFTADFSLTLTVARSDLPQDGPIPQPDQFILYNPDNRRYRIDVVKPDHTGTSLILLCNDPNRGAGVIEREM